MKKQVSKSEFKTRALELIRDVQNTGSPLIVTDRGKPVVEVRPIPLRKQDPLELLHGSVLFYDRPLDPVGEDDWEALSEP